jgi:hypothetical protein
MDNFNGQTILKLIVRVRIYHILDRIICLLCVYICHYIFPFYYLEFFFFDTLKQKALLYKSSRKHTICMRWKFWDFSSFV